MIWKRSYTTLCLILFASISCFANPDFRTTIDLNGQWEFEQTKEAFPPKEFTRAIPIPGLIDLAKPRIEQYEDYFNGTQEPRYNWYRREVDIPANLTNAEAVLTILKSKYVTHAYVNGFEVGNSIACYTPMDFPITHALRYGEKNEILIRVGDKKWLPSASPGTTDKEKVGYIPGIWDDVYLSFTGKYRIHRSLLLPSVADNKVTAKILVRSFYPAQIQYGDKMQDDCQVNIAIREKKSGKTVVKDIGVTSTVKRDNITELELEVPMNNPHLWSPADPFLYTATISLYEGKSQSDQINVHFGMRDFKRADKYFTLNGEKIILRGTNITLHRFFEGPDRNALPWNKEWVKELMQKIPKQLDWNAMRVCVGIAPKFWYDLADEAGIMLQNEWNYWQNHGWDAQVREEYTDWVWADGNHPSIVIWDAINENWDDFIGNILIPDLKKLDPTRIWDAGYMTFEHMTLDEMDEPHPYMVYGMRDNFDQYMEEHPYPLGDLGYWPQNRQYHGKSAPQLVNEYGWIWLWRNGHPAKLTENNYRYYLGENSSSEANRELQAYWLQCQTEWLRTDRTLAGVLAFCYLTNDLGFTGDWFIDDIEDLEWSPALHWFGHCFAPAAVFIDLVDGRYTKHIEPHEPGSWLVFNCIGVNDYDHEVKGKVTVKILDAQGTVEYTQTDQITIPAYDKEYLPCAVHLPEEEGGYVLVSEFTQKNIDRNSPILSRRYLKIGEKETYTYYKINPNFP